MDKAKAAGQKAFTFVQGSLANSNQKDVEVWEHITDVSTLTGPWPYICAVLNFFLPGTGTGLAGIIGDTNSWSKTQLGIGLCQMLTSVYLVGWIWAMYWAYLIVKKTFKDS